ncbi:hypothetical protein ACIA49_20920 [Kribbella sp. NPDC051587]|uniref:hypothetical protein n=1 Tax=Kribbella sp. NPDC051587 TaxID=3364119 RepID=UPI003790F17E
MVKRYQHITATVRMDIAKRVGGLLWQEPKKKKGKKAKDKAEKKSRRPDEGDGGAKCPPEWPDEIGVETKTQT